MLGGDAWSDDLWMRHLPYRHGNQSCDGHRHIKVRQMCNLALRRKGRTTMANCLARLAESGGLEFNRESLPQGINWRRIKADRQL